MKNAGELPVGVGVSSILMILVVLCLTIFGTLALQTAQADWKNSERHAAATAAYYQADAAAQSLLCQIDEILLAARQDAAQIVEEDSLSPIAHRAFYKSDLDPSTLEQILDTDRPDSSKQKIIYHRLAAAGLSSLKIVALEAEMEVIRASFVIQVDENRSLFVTVRVPPYGSKRRIELAEYHVRGAQAGEGNAAS